eukprot:3940773-Rhodomonas_salina.3
MSWCLAVRWKPRGFGTERCSCHGLDAGRQARKFDDLRWELRGVPRDAPGLSIVLRMRSPAT